MSFSYRALQSGDIPICVQHFREHPVLSTRYGNVIDLLPAALSRTFRDDYVVVNLFEETQGATTRYIGAGMAVFVSDSFLQEAKTLPFFWVGPELVRRIAAGNSPLLSEEELRNANSAAALNLMVWHNSCYPQDLRRMEVAVLMMSSFEKTFHGFQLREVFVQADCLEQFHGVRTAGGFYFDLEQGSYGAFPEIDESNFYDEPRNLGTTRELAPLHGATWINTLFVFGPPQFGFSRSEQRQLSGALGGGETDEELGAALGISVSAVKKNWRSVYDRVASCSPELLPDNFPIQQWEVETRGKQKKQRLLAYLREHPEELRPFSQRLFQSQLNCRGENIGPRSSFPSSKSPEGQ
jgi:hypothetical protein